MPVNDPRKPHGRANENNAQRNSSRANADQARAARPRSSAPDASRASSEHRRSARGASAARALRTASPRAASRRDAHPRRARGAETPRIDQPRRARDTASTRGESAASSRARGAGSSRAARPRSTQRAAQPQGQPLSFSPLVDKASDANSLPERIFGVLAAVLLGIVSLIVRALQLLAHAVASIARRSRAAAVVMVVAAVLVVGGAIDAFATNGKVYAGVSIGTVDVSGMTADEARGAVEAAYAPQLDSAQVVIFANDDVAASVDVEQQIVQDQATAEQVSFEQAQKDKSLWLETAQTLSATVPTDALVDEAMSVGRAGIGIFDRIGAALGGKTIDVSVQIGADELETLAQDIDTSIGNPRQDFDIKIEQGEVSIVEGHDGWMVNRDTLASELSRALLQTDGSASSFTAHTEYAPLRIDEAAAQQTRDAVDALIDNGATFTSNGTNVDVARAELGGWVATRVEEHDGAFRLAPYLDATAASAELVGMVNASAGGESVSVDFTVEGDDVSVTPRSEVTVPRLVEALDALDQNLFASYRATGAAGTPSTESIAIATQQVSGTLSFDEALSCGLVTEISSFTTQYTNSSSTQNRNHNIHLAADLLNNSVAESDGGDWSFNGTTGNCNEEAGFLPAGAIAGDEYVDEAGGGICQVATTVFNAVYEAGYTVTRRQNHTLYMASYPAGRDAAVSYPDLDFVWRNDTSSDVLLRTSYTDTSVTITLYGVDPGYTVTTETGEWVEGEKHSTRTERDDTLSPGRSYVKTVGTDGLEITVTRTVKEKDGTIVRQDAFHSIYAPITEVIVKGPDATSSNENSTSSSA
ncbi:MAG: VanW family protein [Eggerthellaceae bacterium]|nr:VanW family protein [Eggerthellaceae bacterium]